MGFRGRTEDPRPRRIRWQDFNSIGESRPTGKGHTGKARTGEGRGSKSAEDLRVERAARVIQRRSVSF